MDVASTTATDITSSIQLKDLSPEARLQNIAENPWQAGPPTSALSSGDEIRYPEGGLQAWLVVFGGFCGMTAAFGYMNTIGVFQAYLVEHQLRGYSESTVGWIFSVYVFISLFGGLIIGPVFDAKGPKWLLVAGGVLSVVGTMVMSVCEEYWHFMLSVGIVLGFGTSLLFTPSISAAGHFFLEKRGMATGVAATGGSIGGVVFPLMLQSLIPQVGWGWAIRTLGFITLLLSTIAVALVRSRLPPRPGTSIMPDLKIFRDISFALTAIGTCFLDWAYFLPITYLSSFVVHKGLAATADDGFGFQIITILNAGSVVGRLLPGYIADRFGRYNCIIMTLSLCAISNLALWLPATLLSTGDETLKPLVIVFAVLFGFACGSNVSLTPVCIGQLCATEDYGRYYATCYTLCSFATLTGVPLGGALIQSCGGNYWGVVVFTGVCYVVSFTCYGAVRVMNVGWKARVLF